MYSDRVSSVNTYRSKTRTTSRNATHERLNPTHINHGNRPAPGTSGPSTTLAISNGPAVPASQRSGTGAYTRSPAQAVDRNATVAITACRGANTDRPTPIQHAPTSHSDHSHPRLYN